MHSQVPPREPPPYRQVQPPPPIYQPVRQRPYFNQHQGYGAPPPQQQQPNRYPRMHPYNPRPRHMHQPYAVEPLRYRNPYQGYDPKYAHAPESKLPPPVVTDAPVPEPDPGKFLFCKSLS